VSCVKHRKRGYLSKREAERAIRMYHPGEHLDTFECDLGTGMWHVGHLPDPVIQRGVPRDIATRKRKSKK
jgi:hypothetical protein